MFGKKCCCKKGHRHNNKPISNIQEFLDGETGYNLSNGIPKAKTEYTCLDCNAVIRETLSNDDPISNEIVYRMWVEIRQLKRDLREQYGLREQSVNSNVSYISEIVDLRKELAAAKESALIKELVDVKGLPKRKKV